MSDITVITPPDFLANNNFKLMLINPGTEIRQCLNTLLSTNTQPIDIYLYEDTDSTNLDWVLQNVESSDIVVVDIDNCGSILKNIVSYIISKPRTFYLTNDEVTPYNIISNNRIYDLDWLDIYIRGLNE
jgi:predicted nucleic acid-binding Zn ribbon protein